MNKLAGADFRAFGDVDSLQKRVPVALTFGNFDGVHKGHQKLISDLRELAPELPLVAFAFDPHPHHFFQPHTKKPLLMTLEEKCETLLLNGADIVYVQNFDQKFCSLTADQFLDPFLVCRFEVGAVTLGFNFCYGRDRQGCWTHFYPWAKQRGWKVSHSTPFLVDDIEVSSSKIREYILLGQMRDATRYLGRPYFMESQVVEGDKRGRLLGYPTANLAPSSKVTPAFGVYACWVERLAEGTKHLAVLNCGVRPTFEKQPRLQLEVHLLDFHENLYDQWIRVHFIEKLRDELKFAGVESLKTQMALDVQRARRLLKGV
jgi:riboflavin kinase / FMN adenylyltransferase